MKEIKPLVRWRQIERKYPVAHLLGKTRENDALFRHAEVVLTLREHMVCYKPVIYELDVYNQNADLLDAMCFQKLLDCDLCVVVTPDHIGPGTKNRIHQAYLLGIPVYLWDDTTETLSEFGEEDMMKRGIFSDGTTR